MVPSFYLQYQGALGMHAFTSMQKLTSGSIYSAYRKLHCHVIIWSLCRVSQCWTTGVWSQTKIEADFLFTRSYVCLPLLHLNKIRNHNMINLDPSEQKLLAISQKQLTQASSRLLYKIVTLQSCVFQELQGAEVAYIYYRDWRVVNRDTKCIVCCTRMACPV